MSMNAKMPAITVPPFFRCPISLELMTDPVTLSTGLTYDRQSIEKWLQEGHRTCPASMQALESHPELLPNHTLRRLIQQWCTTYQAQGVERIPSLKPPARPQELQVLLGEIQDHGSSSSAIYSLLKRLRMIAHDSEKNRSCVAEVGAIPVLFRLLSSFSEIGENTDFLEVTELCEEAIATLVLLPLESAAKKHTVVSAIAFVLRKGSLEGKVNAARLVQKIVEGEGGDSVKLLAGEQKNLIAGLVRLLRGDFLYRRAVKSSLIALQAISEPRKNRLRTVEAGAVGVLFELLPEASPRNTERILALLEILCNTPEGRAAVMRHALAIPVLVAILRTVSDVGTEHGVTILWSIAQSAAADKSTMQGMVEEGVFAQLLYVIQADSNAVTKQKSADLLKKLHRFVREHPCSRHRHYV